MNKEISLRKARKLDSAIYKKIHGEKIYHDDDSFNFDTSKKLGVFDNIDIDLWLPEQIEETVKQVSLLEKLIEARYIIRRLIQQTNEQSGINELISKQTKTKEISKLYKRVISCKTAKDPEALKKMKEHEINSSSTFTSTEIAVDVVDEKTQQMYKNLYKGFEKTINDLDDQLIELNVKTTITLPDYVFNTLKEAEIII